MKKVILITLEFPPFHGGVATYTGMLAEALGERCVVITPPVSVSPHGAASSPHTLYTTVYKKLLFHRFLFWPRWARACAVLLAVYMRTPVGICITPHILPLGYVLFLFKHLFGIPYAINAHGLDLKIAMAHPWKRFWLKRILRSSAFIFVNSLYTKKLIAEVTAIPESKIYVIYPCPQVKPLISNELISQIRSTFALSGKRLLLSVGRLTRRKGFDRVIMSLPTIINAIPDLVYVIAGEGEELQALGDLIALHGMQNHVRLVGPLSDEKLWAFYHMADVFIMPSREERNDVEGFGIVYLEAARCGVPSIAAKGGGVEEAVIHGQTGLLFSGDASGLQESVITLFSNDTLRRQLGEGAQRRVNTEFIWQHQLSPLLSTLQKFL